MNVVATYCDPTLDMQTGADVVTIKDRSNAQRGPDGPEREQPRALRRRDQRGAQDGD
jgi:hypothetical protein